MLRRLYPNINAFFTVQLPITLNKHLLPVSSSTVGLKACVLYSIQHSLRRRGNKEYKTQASKGFLFRDTKMEIMVSTMTLSELLFTLLASLSAS